MNRELINRLTGNGAAYIRVSTDDQDTHRQHTSIDAFLTDTGLSIPRQFRFEDTDWARDEAKKRPEFQRMLKAVEAGLIQWIVSDRQDRFGTKDKYEFIAFMHQLREHRCIFLTVDGKVFTDDNMMSFIEGGMNAETSTREVQEKSWRVVKDRIERAKRGDWLGGYPPFGCDVVCFDQGMREKWRVVFLGKRKRLRVWPDGRSERFDGKNNFPAADNNDILQLRPSQENERIKTVCFIFETYAGQTIAPLRIAKLLNKMGVKPLADRWTHNNVVDVLRNPIYLGTQRTFGVFNGKYFDLQDGELVLSSDKKQRRRKQSEWVMSGQLFPEMIDKTIWDRVQEKLSKTPDKKRAPKNPNLFLTGLLHCAHCGKKMKAWAVRREYLCSSYGKTVSAYDVADAPQSCDRNGIAHADLMDLIKQYVADVGKELETFIQVYKTGNLDLLKPYYEKHSQNISLVTASIDRMAEMCDAATGNLAVPNPALGIFDPRWGWSCDILDRVAHDTSPDAVENLSKHDEALKELQERYRGFFHQSEEQRRTRLERLEREASVLGDQIMNLPKSAKRQIERQGRKLVQIEQQMDRLEAELKNYSDEVDAVMAGLSDHLNVTTAARAALEGDGTTEALKMAEAVRHVIKEIRLEFEPTGKKWPKTQPIAAIIVSPLGEETKYSLCGKRTPS
ncbi:MAG: recombinase family protein [Planctomycetaceae bacterium]|nr:recombinase family protein [Planctomycetaceae bacterium]